MSERVTTRALLIAGIVLAVALVVVLFFVGLRVNSTTTTAPPTPTPSTATPTPTPTPTAEAVAPPGPRVPGDYAWDELHGGECLTGYTSPWAERFTVVDCAAPHTAQIVAAGAFADPADPAAVFPGEAALAARMNLICTAPTALALDAAAALPDIQWQAAYPVSEAEWAEGHRSYFCFVSRSSGEPLGASLVPAQG